jgi:type II secretory pathway component PulM
MSRTETLLASLQAFWTARSRRERWILLAGGGISLLILAWLLVWNPVDQWAADQQRRLERTAETAAIVSRGRERLEQAEENDRGTENPAKALAASSRSPMREARRVAERLDILEAIERREPIDDQGLRIAFAEIPFSTLSRWIAEMQRRGFVVTQARLAPVDPDRPQGRVRAELELAARSS